MTSPLDMASAIIADLDTLHVDLDSDLEALNAKLVALKTALGAPPPPPPVTTKSGTPNADGNTCLDPVPTSTRPTWGALDNEVGTVVTIDSHVVATKALQFTLIDSTSKAWAPGPNVVPGKTLTISVDQRANLPGASGKVDVEWYLGATFKSSASGTAVALGTDGKWVKVSWEGVVPSGVDNAHVIPRVDGVAGMQWQITQGIYVGTGGAVGPPPVDPPVDGMPPPSGLVDGKTPSYRIPMTGTAIDRAHFTTYVGDQANTGNEHWRDFCVTKLADRYRIFTQGTAQGALRLLKYWRPPVVLEWVASQTSSSGEVFLPVTLGWPRNDSTWSSGGPNDVVEPDYPERNNGQWCVFHHYSTQPGTQSFRGSLPIVNGRRHRHTIVWLSTKMSYYLDGVKVHEDSHANAPDDFTWVFQINSMGRSDAQRSGSTGASIELFDFAAYNY